MTTFQDLMETKEDIKDFVYKAIDDYKTSTAYFNALDGINYSTGKNTVILAYKKLLYTITGEAVADNFSANHKCPANFLQRLSRQEASFLLSNGVQFENEATKKKLGKKIDSSLYMAAKNAIIQGAVYGFFNYDHVEYFTASEFVPLFDEETGQLRAGIRFWQIESEKPLRATLYEEDGYTEFIKKSGKTAYMSGDNSENAKKTYKNIIKSSDADGTQIVPGGNYEGFPIVPLYANTHKESELISIKSQIDAFDLIKSGFANDLDDASMIYWTLENCGGMSDVDLVKFRDRIKTIGAAVVDGDQGARAEAHTIDIPYQSREAYLTRLEKDIIKDFMGLDTEQLALGNVTATQIKAAYEAINQKCDELEYCIIEHLQAILKIAGVEDDYPSFKRSQISNEAETAQTIMLVSSLLDEQTVLELLPFLTPEMVDKIMERKEQEEMQRYLTRPEGNEGFIEGEE